jgi:hypothetical protein
MRQKRSLRGGLQECVQQCRDLATPFVRFAQAHRLSCMVIDGATTIALRGVAWGGDHPLLALRTPQGVEGRQPREIACLGIVKDLSRLQASAGRVNRLFFPGIRGQDCTCYVADDSRPYRPRAETAGPFPLRHGCRCSAIESAKRAKVERA